MTPFQFKNLFLLMIHKYRIEEEKVKILFINRLFGNKLRNCIIGTNILKHNLSILILKISILISKNVILITKIIIFSINMAHFKNLIRIIEYAEFKNN